MFSGRPAQDLAHRKPGWMFVSLALIAGALVIIATWRDTLAAPDHPAAGHTTAAQNVDYISASSGSMLDLGFPVLVPSWVPAPFGGEPSIDGSGGYYSLYWMNGGGEPTFLQVTGVVGGGLPAGSPYDLNIQLSINASVNGYGAIHDVTPIYDTVWWIQGGVLYTVTSRNMTGTDSLSLANSLITFVPPAAPEPEPTEPPAPDPDPVDEPTSPPADSGTGDSGSGDSGSSDSGTTDSSSANQDTSDQATTTQSQSTDDTATSATEEATEEASTTTGSDGTGQPSVASDGTGGPPVEVAKSDGTGGSEEEIVVPRKVPILYPVP